MKFKRIFAKIAYEILDPNRVPLKPALSRARNRFVQACVADYTQYEKDRNDIIMHYVPKDAEGNPKWKKDDDGQPIQRLLVSDIPEDQQSEFIEQMNELLNEDFVFEENEKNKPVIDALRIILADLDIIFQNEDETYFYDQFCDLLEVSLEDGLSAVVSKLSER